MNTTIIIASIALPIFAITGISLLLNAKWYKEIVKSLAENPSAMHMRGVMSFLIGTIVILFHSRWTADWSIVVTILGAIALIKGALILLLPNTMTKFLKNHATNKRAAYFA